MQSPVKLMLHGAHMGCYAQRANCVAFPAEWLSAETHPLHVHPHGATPSHPTTCVARCTPKLAKTFDAPYPKLCFHPVRRPWPCRAPRATSTAWKAAGPRRRRSSHGLLMAGLHRQRRRRRSSRNRCLTARACGRCGGGIATRGGAASGGAGSGLVPPSRAVKIAPHATLWLLACEGIGVGRTPFM